MRHALSRQRWRTNRCRSSSTPRSSACSQLSSHRCSLRTAGSRSSAAGSSRTTACRTTTRSPRSRADATGSTSSGSVSSPSTGSTRVGGIRLVLAVECHPRRRRVRRGRRLRASTRRAAGDARARPAGRAPAVPRHGDERSDAELRVPAVRSARRACSSRDRPVSGRVAAIAARVARRLGERPRLGAARGRTDRASRCGRAVALAAKPRRRGCCCSRRGCACSPRPTTCISCRTTTETAFNPSFATYLSQWAPTTFSPISAPLLVLAFATVWMLGRSAVGIHAYERWLLGCGSRCSRCSPFATGRSRHCCSSCSRRTASTAPCASARRDRRRRSAPSIAAVAALGALAGIVGALGAPTRT